HFVPSARASVHARSREMLLGRPQKYSANPNHPYTRFGNVRARRELAITVSDGISDYVQNFSSGTTPLERSVPRHCRRTVSNDQSSDWWLISITQKHINARRATSSGPLSASSNCARPVIKRYLLHLDAATPRT